MKRALIFTVILITAAATTVTAQPCVSGKSPHDGHGCAGSDWIGGPLLAQGGPDGRPMGMGHRGGGRRGMMAEMRQKRKHIEQLRMLKMLELLDLQSDQEVAFLTAFNRMRNGLQDLDDRQVALLDTLGNGLSEETLADTDIYRMVDRLIDLKQARVELMDGFVEQARAMLTAEQFGKMVVFQERFDFELLQQLRAFRGQSPADTPAGDGAPDPEEK